MKRPEMIPLTEAAHRLRRSYNQTLRLVLLGELKGAKNGRGRWEVDASDVERLRTASYPDQVNR